MGTPGIKSEEVGRDLVKARAARSVVNATAPSRPLVAEEIRSKLDGGLQMEIEGVLDLSSKISDLEVAIGSLQEQEDSLTELEPLGVDLDLLSGYESIVAFVGRVDDIPTAREASSSGLMIESRKQDGMVAMFLRKRIPKSESLLESVGFQQSPIPPGTGAIPDLLAEIRTEKDSTVDEKTRLERELESWSQSHGETLVCGLEVLERDHEILTAPVRVAVSEHAFVIDGWLEMRRADEIERALKDSCLHTKLLLLRWRPEAEAWALRPPPLPADASDFLPREKFI